MKSLRSRWLAAAALVCAAPSLFAAASGESAATDQEPLIWLGGVQGPRDPAEGPLWDDEVFRLTGVRVQTIRVPGSEHTTKLTTMLATGEPLDIAYINASNLERLYDQDLVAALTDRIEASPVLSDPNIIAPSEWERLRRPNGEIYGVFNKFEQGTMPIIRYDWLEKLGLEEPTTFDEYYQVLRAFTFDDPDGNGEDDTFGMAIGFTTYDLTGLFGAYGLMRGFQRDASGKLYSPWATEQAIPVYQFMARLYREGILEPNFITNGSSNFRDLFMTDKSGMNFYWAAWVGLYNQQVKAESPNSQFKARGILPPRVPGGGVLLRAGGDGLMITPQGSPNQDRAFQIMEFWHTEAGNVLSTLGIRDHDYTFANGTYTLTETGRAHSMDHGAPQPKSLAWTNPLGELEGFEEAAALIRQYAQPQLVTEFDSQWEEITRSEAARIVLGDISAAQGIANMNRRFAEEGIGR